MIMYYDSGDDGIATLLALVFGVQLALLAAKTLDGIDWPWLVVLTPLLAVAAVLVCAALTAGILWFINRTIK